MTADTAAPAPFAALKERIKARWPDVDEAALDATAGDLEQIAELLGHLSDRSKTAIQQQLEELSRAARTSTDENLARLSATLERLEARADQLGQQIHKDLLPRAEEKIKDNLLVSLLVALGLGFVIGIVFGVSVGRGR
jgi:ElaB/YqjD/DUF883 family membrane-anchored ribosome-binding protein